MLTVGYQSGCRHAPGKVVLMAAESKEHFERFGGYVVKSEEKKNR